MKSRRLISNKEIYSIMRNATDFYQRSHTLNPIKIIYWLSIILVAALFLMQCFSGVISASLTKYKLDNLVISTMVINFFFIVLVISTTYLIYKMQRIVLITEFQNLLFSSSMREKSLFYVIFSHKNVVYFDENGRKFFQIHDNVADIAILLEKMQVSNKEQDQIIQKIQQKEQFTITYNYKDKSIKLDLIPLERPKGFFSLKGTYN